MPDKILITNREALTNKYKTAGMKAIATSVSALSAADKKRGFATRMIDISDAATMKKFKVGAVSNAKSGRQNKDAVDAIYAALRPDYIVLLGGPDIIPHLSLTNPLPGDGDVDVPSDLPYASDASFTKRGIANYCAITRVVGRIPDITGASDPKFLLNQIANSLKFKTRDREDYLKHFAISADVWKDSTLMSVEAIFNAASMRICPPTGHPKVNTQLSSMMHFINCHGARADPQFYGEDKKKNFPVALHSGGVSKHSKADTIVAAECCYGAELFDPIQANGGMPISLSYLANKAAGFFGSTNVAYGPPAGNSAADLVTQYFLINVLAGASLGRACLQARQKFVQTQKMASAVNLKTIGQFYLLGDPSIHPCMLPQLAAETGAKVLDAGIARATRRTALAAFGKAAAASSAFLAKPVRAPGATLAKNLRSLARKRGFRATEIAAYAVKPGEDYREPMKARSVEPKVLVITEKTQSNGKKSKKRKAGAKRPEGISEVRVLEAIAQGNKLTTLTEYISR